MRVEPVTRNSQFTGPASVWVPIAVGDSPSDDAQPMSRRPEVEEVPSLHGAALEQCPVALGGEYTLNIPHACSDLEEGDPVYSRWHGGDLFYDGTLASKIHSDGTFDIRYNDGDYEAKVAPNLIMCQVQPVRG